MADKGMKKRWISLYVENQVGVIDVYRYSVKILDCRVYLGLKCGI